MDENGRGVHIPMLDLVNYRNLVEGFYKRIAELPETTAHLKPSEDAWSLKEIIGHLTDSASNNHQRFVRLQSDDLLAFPAYTAEPWVRVQSYRTMDWNGIVSLWYAYNRLLIHIIDNADSSSFSHVWVKNEEAIPFEELIVDYYRHMKVHIEQFDTRLREVENIMNSGSHSSNG